MSRVGNPYDNAKAERFIRTLKSEEIDGTRYRDHRDAADHIGAFIAFVDHSGTIDAGQPVPIFSVSPTGCSPVQSAVFAVSAAK
jgi:transposase InsO family protein